MIATSRYAFIVGHDILKFGFILDYVHNFISWDGLSIHMTLYAREPSSAVVVTHFSYTHTFNENYATCINKINEAKYDLIYPEEIAS